MVFILWSATCLLLISTFPILIYLEWIFSNLNKHSLTLIGRKRRSGSALEMPDIKSSFLLKNKMKARALLRIPLLLSTLLPTHQQILMCPPGKYFFNSACASCLAGTFSYFTGSTACQSCPLGTGSSPGASKCTACSSSADCRTASGSQCASCAGSCAACAPGKYSPGGSTVSCIACKVFFSLETKMLLLKLISKNRQEPTPPLPRPSQLTHVSIVNQEPQLCPQPLPQRCAPSVLCSTKDSLIMLSI